MLRRTALIAIIVGAYAGAMYTSTGCGPLPTEPTDMASLSGVATNAITGATVGNATVTASQGSFQSVVQTVEPGGYYSMLVRIGQNRIDVAATGYKPFTATTTVKSGANGFFIKLQPQ